ncbi:MAG: hypothetical protein JWL60_1687 [Gemmatimonadetes bacterium]|jgi:hypothetical protein|nr:hypothetical protein [Gemmatimonadota bacterium]
MHRRLRREDPAYLAAMREAKAMFEAEMAKSAMKGRGRPKTVVVPAAAAPVADEDVLDLVDEAPEGATGEFKIDVDEPEEGDEGDEHEEAEEAPAARSPGRKASKSASTKPAPAKTAKKGAAPARGARAKAAKPAAKDAKAKKPAAKKR